MLKPIAVPQKNHGWILDSGLSRSLDMGTHITRFLDRIEPHISAIRGVADEAEVDLSCVLYDEHMSVLCVDRRALQVLAECGASLEFDTYRIE